MLLIRVGTAFGPTIVRMHSVQYRIHVSAVFDVALNWRANDAAP